MIADTVASSLWLSLVDMAVVFAVLTLLMFICYGLRFFSRDLLIEGSGVEESEGVVDVAAGDEAASESLILQNMTPLGDVHEGPQKTVIAPEPRSDVSPATSLGVQGPARSAGLRVFRITVEDKVFDVEVAQSEAGQPVVQSLSQTATAVAPVIPAPVAAPAIAEKPMAPPPSRPAPSPGQTHGTTASNLMKSPLPGKVLKVFAAPGKAFRRGDTLMIIEAMKMENEILAPRDCVVAEVFVAVNQSVKTGEPLLRME